MQGERGGNALDVHAYCSYNLYAMNSFFSITSTTFRWIGALLLSALFLGTLGACSPGHIGSNQIGFLRHGALWAIDPNGSNLHQIEAGQVVGFSWSPDHHLIALRMANGRPPQQLQPLGLGDLNSEAGVTAIDGGHIIQITPPDSGLLRSDAWWNASGTRLLYREEHADVQGHPGPPQWKLSQNDQPAGIARKDLPDSAVLPAVNSDGRQIASITPQGQLLVGQPGGTPSTLANHVLTTLPGSNYPARPLWQPSTGALLYAVAGPTPGETTLLLRQSDGTAYPLATLANLQQYAWSPDGHSLLVRTASEYRVYSASGATRFSWSDAASVSLAFWSPDSRFVLLLEPAGISLVDIAARRYLSVLYATIALPPAPGAGQAPFMRPATNSPWNADGSAFLFTADRESIWSAQPDRSLPTMAGSGNGLYLSALDHQHGVPQFPTLLDWGEHQNIAWTTLEPNCAFLLT